MGLDYLKAERKVLLRYGAAVAIVLAAAALRLALQPVMGVAPPYITFYLAVAAASAFGGFGPGIFATVLGALLGVGIAVLPIESLHLHTAAEQIRLALYLTSGIAISAIAGRMHRAKREADAEAQEMRQLSEELRIANQRLLESDRSKDRFVAVVAHELRNPLMPIKSGLHLLKAHKADAQVVDKTLDMISRQVDQMSMIVDDLLDATRIRHNKLDLQRARVDLRELVARVVDDHRQQFLSRAVGLHRRRPSRPLYVYADAVRLSQVVGNLLHNALKFTPERGDVYVDLEPQGERALLRVRDTGVGIKPETISRIFEPFEQGEQAGNHVAGGLGLGLALVKTIVELHGGTVEARSPGRNKGAEFLVALPLDTAAELEGPGSTVTPLPVPPPVPRGEPASGEQKPL